MKRTSLSLAGAISAVVLFFLAVFVIVSSEKAVPLPSDEISPPSDNCTVIMAGKDATIDGSTITTHTADCGIVRLDLAQSPGRRP